MKIAIPTDDTINVSEYFGRALFFSATDTVANEINILRNKSGGGEHHHSANGHDHHADEIAQLLNDVDVVITSHMGKPMIERLQKSGKEIYIVPRGKTISEAVKLFVEGKARRLKTTP